MTPAQTNSLPLASQDPLAALRDLVAPTAVSWWPLAPGWWLLIAVLLAALGYTGWWLWRRYRARQYLREARALLAAIGEQLQAGQPAPALLAETIEVLRRVALQHGDLAPATGLSAEPLLNALNRAHPAKTALPVDPALLESALYTAQPASTDHLTAYAQALCGAAQQWSSTLPQRIPPGGRR